MAYKRIFITNIMTCQHYFYEVLTYYLYTAIPVRVTYGYQVNKNYRRERNINYYTIMMLYKSIIIL